MTPADARELRTARIVACAVSAVCGCAILALTQDRTLAWLGGVLVGAGVMRLLYLFDPTVGR